MHQCSNLVSNLEKTIGLLKSLQTTLIYYSWTNRQFSHVACWVLSVLCSKFMVSFVGSQCANSKYVGKNRRWTTHFVPRKRGNCNVFGQNRSHQTDWLSDCNYHIAGHVLGLRRGVSNWAEQDAYVFSWSCVWNNAIQGLLTTAESDQFFIQLLNGCIKIIKYIL